MHHQAIRREAFRLIDENRERLYHHRPLCPPLGYQSVVDQPPPLIASVLR
jgi:hypothetical protein